jgi:hypothetical protein
MKTNLLFVLKKIIVETIPIINKKIALPIMPKLDINDTIIFLAPNGELNSSGILDATNCALAG